MFRLYKRNPKPSHTRNRSKQLDKDLVLKQFGSHTCATRVLQSLTTGKVDKDKLSIPAQSIKRQLSASKRAGKFSPDTSAFNCWQ
jgi:hypothetical protein